MQGMSGWRVVTLFLVSLSSVAAKPGMEWKLTITTFAGLLLYCLEKDVFNAPRRPGLTAVDRLRSPIQPETPPAAWVATGPTRRQT